MSDKAAKYDKKTKAKTSILQSMKKGAWINKNEMNILANKKVSVTPKKVDAAIRSLLKEGKIKMIQVQKTEGSMVGMQRSFQLV